MIIIHNQDGSRTVMTYEEAVAKGYIKQPKVTWSAGMIKQKAQEKMNNEPVAWYYENKNGVSWVSGTREKHDKNFVAVEKPLYTHPASLVDWSYQQGYQVGKETHPAKTLTNEEIEEAYRETNEPVSGIGYNMTNGLYAFARAILRKAQEK